MGVKEMEFPGVFKKKNVEIPGVNLKRSGISEDYQEKIMRNFHGSWFLALEFPNGVEHNFVEFPGVCETLFCPEFLLVKLKT